MSDKIIPVELIRALAHLDVFVGNVQKCPDHRSLASLDASDHITVGDMRALARGWRLARVDEALAKQLGESIAMNSRLKAQILPVTTGETKT